jgi:hypothetical protein
VGEKITASECYAVQKDHRDVGMAYIPVWSLVLLDEFFQAEVASSIDIVHLQPATQFFFPPEVRLCDIDFRSER